MAFCNSCGNQLKGTEKFCAQCGATVGAAASSASAAPPPPAGFAPGPTPAAVPPPMQPMGAPAQYGAPPPGAIPVPYPPPPAQPAKKNGMIGTIVVIVIVVGLGYYYYNKMHPTPQASNPPASQPSTPSSNPPASTPPPPSSGGGPNAALVNQQSFNAQWQDQSGMLVLTTAKWTNNSTSNLASAVVQCEQYDASGTDLSQYRVTLNGPTQANAVSSYSNIRIGAVANNMAKVNCSVVHVKTE